MHPIFNYDLYIFDCDGVIFDSNNLKVDAMRNALTDYSDGDVEKCLDYFASNFGKSRYHHVEFFLNNILPQCRSLHEEEYDRILNSYSEQCYELYLKSNLSDGFKEFIHQISSVKYVASGSAQDELRVVFSARKIDNYFCEVFGSPTSKRDNVATILSLHPCSKVVMIGDSYSDYKAAVDNNIDFIYYSKLSLVKDEMQKLKNRVGFEEIECWSELI